MVQFFTPQPTLYEELKNENDLIKQSKGLEFWIHRTCFELNRIQTTEKYKVVDKIPDDGVIVFHKGYFPKNLKPNGNQYFVCVQADYGRHRFAQMHIVQNDSQVNGPAKSRQSIIDKWFAFSSNEFMPHWPQPGIIPRNKARGVTIENIGFFGNPEQFPQDQLEAIRTICQDAGLNLQLKLTSDQWIDYSDTDVALALRSFDNKPYHNKPFSKVMNAVTAGSLVVAGNESANVFFKHRYYNCLPVVSSIPELKSALLDLQRNSTLHFEHLLQAGESMEELRTENIAQQWRMLLLKAEESYLIWRKSPARRKLFAAIRSL